MAKNPNKIRAKRVASDYVIDTSAIISIFRRITPL